MAQLIHFDRWFETLTGHTSPRSWQRQLAQEMSCRDRLIRIPTGLGKTEGVLSAWSFHRLCRSDDCWPRRLVWCLPMRVLVEQTEQSARTIAERLPASQRPEVHVLMGGEDSGEWFLFPERSAILIGTQDMLLSRALNRGYASGRARWPVEFGLLNQDALWIMDEVQLMDVGLATSAQLQAFRGEDQRKSIRPCHTWWMSATLQPDWLRSVDTVQQHAEWVRDPCSVPPTQRTGGLWDVTKSLTCDAVERGDANTFAQRVLTEHAATPTSEHGRITLVVCNTVERACQTFDNLQAAGRTNGIELVHSRFRPAERQNWRERFLSRAACTADADRIIVATQVVEAGVDISAGCLITELAPWPSLVQRFGRCARYGGSGRVVVVDRGRDEKAAPPYSPEELESAWEALQTLTAVEIASLEAHEESLTAEGRERLFPYSPSHLLLRREFDELFDTTPDLTGADLDISRFIRSGDERDLQVFWIELAKEEKPSDKQRPQRSELCSVPFLKARDWLCGAETKTNRKPKLRGSMRAWIWDWLDGEWIEASRASLLPGRIVCVAASCGGYRVDRGFDPVAVETVPVVPTPEPPAETQALDQADNRQDGENLSYNEWKTIACHSGEVTAIVGEIAHQLALGEEIEKVLALAGHWHDVGKSHPAFQGALRSNDRPRRQDLAKGPQGCWLRPLGTYRFADNSDSRPAFRHELASALALFAVLETFQPQHPALLGPWGEALQLLGLSIVVSAPTASPPPSIQQVLDCSADEFNLLAYLVASHHGKVRAGLHAAPKDQDYRDRDHRGLPIRGVREGDHLPGICLDSAAGPLPELSLTLEPASLGLSTRTGASWRGRCDQLLAQFGPGGVAFLESLLRAADVRASRLRTNDPALQNEVSA
jgi:CRISPR-associated endonuclease/helicase Cas3